MRDDGTEWTDDYLRPGFDRYVTMINSLTEEERALLKLQGLADEQMARAHEAHMRSLVRVVRFTSDTLVAVGTPITHRKLDLPPGTRLARILSAALPLKLYRIYVAPTIADMQFEYIDAVSKNPQCSALWIKVRGYISVVFPLLYALVARLVRAFLPGSRSA